MSVFHPESYLGLLAKDYNKVGLPLFLCMRVPLPLQDSKMSACCLWMQIR